MRSLQLILQDMRISETVVRARLRDQSRLAEVLAGSPIHPAEELVPTREEIARVFTSLRDDARRGNMTVSERTLTERSAPIGPVKLRLIIRILNEMGVCRVKDPIDGIFIFEVNFDAPKTTIDASPLMQSLRRQLAAGSAT